MYICAYACLFISKLIDSSDTGDMRKELELFCSCRVLTLSMKWYYII